jgi:hypothetical protein
MDEQRVISGVLPDAGPPTKPICAVSIVTCFHRSWDEITLRIEEPLRLELRCIMAIVCRIAMALPEIRKAKGSLGDEHAFIPVILCHGMGNAE